MLTNREGSYRGHCRRTLWCIEHYMETREGFCWGEWRKEPSYDVHWDAQTISHNFLNHHVACWVHGLK